MTSLKDKVLCIKDFKHSYKSWILTKDEWYTVEYNVCSTCGSGVCVNSSSRTHEESVKVHKGNDFYNITIITFQNHFKTIQDIREDKLNKLLRMWQLHKPHT